MTTANLSQTAIVFLTVEPNTTIISQEATVFVCYEYSPPPQLVPIRLPEYIFKGRGRYVYRK